jgi:hypothetical protein
MGFWKAFGDAIIKSDSPEDEILGTNPVNKVSGDKKVVRPIFAETTNFASTNPSREGGNLTNENAGNDIDPAYIQLFLKFLEEKDLPGPDFLEFSKALHDLEPENLPEDQMYRMAFLGFKTQKLPVELLENTGDQYLQLMADYHTQCMNSLEGERSKGVDGKKDQNEGLKQENVRLDGEIKKLEKQIQDFKKQQLANKKIIDESEGAILQEAERIKRKGENFEKAYTMFINEITETKNKIKQYLKK